MTNLHTPDTSLNQGDTSSIPGLTFRLLSDPSDYEGMAAVYTESNLADGTGYAIPAGDLERVYFGDPNIDTGRDLLLAEVNGLMVSYTLTTWWDDVTDIRIYYHNTFTLPEWRDKGIEAASLQRAERRLLELAATHSTPQGRTFETVANNTSPERAVLLQTEGYEPVRQLHRMQRSNLNDIPTAALPDGIEARPATPGQYKAIWDASLEAGADEWGMSVFTEEDYEHFREGPFFHPDLWQVAWYGDQVVGSVLNYVVIEENKMQNRKRGYISALSVQRSWRKRGIARALLARSLQTFRDNGMTEAALVLDGQDPRGCVHLCESMGFRLKTQLTYYRKPMP
ncbi:MAG: GNAT family N-acetyltransferase [Chloroflexota bacterium]